MLRYLRLLPAAERAALRHSWQLEQLESSHEKPARSPDATEESHATEESTLRSVPHTEEWTAVWGMILQVPPLPLTLTLTLPLPYPYP